MKGYEQIQITERKQDGDSLKTNQTTMNHRRIAKDMKDMNGNKQENITVGKIMLRPGTVTQNSVITGLIQNNKT
jgi:hypothetical protein